MRRWLLIQVVLIGLVQMPVAAFFGGLISEAIKPVDFGIGFGGYLFFTGFALLPIGLCWLLLIAPKFKVGTSRLSRVLRFVFVAITLSASYTGSIIGFADLHTDAQAALAFVVFPIYACLIPLLGALLAYGPAAIKNLVK